MLFDDFVTATLSMKSLGSPVLVVYAYTLKLVRLLVVISPALVDSVFAANLISFDETGSGLYFSSSLEQAVTRGTMASNEANVICVVFFIVNIFLILSSGRTGKRPDWRERLD